MTTHYALLKELAQIDARFENGSFEFDAETAAPTYRLRIGMPGASSALAVAARMGLRSDVLERANELLDREDRRLERTLAELSSSRVALDRERSDALRAREESEATRDELRRKLLQLQERRDRLFESMRRDLDAAFQRAHGEVATVIRDLQRGGADARDAARAREKLLAIAAQTREVEAEAERSSEPGSRRGAFRAHSTGATRKPGIASSCAAAARESWYRCRIDAAASACRSVPRGWSFPPSASAGAGRRRGRRGAAGAHGPCLGRGPRRGRRTRGRHRALRPARAARRTGRRADRGRARSRRAARLRARARRPRPGTGALRDAIRAHLAASPYVERTEPGHPDAGGEGVTEVVLR